MDLGSLPPVRAAPSELILAVAKLLLCCADSAASMPGSAVSLQTRYRPEEGQIAISVSDNGRCPPDALASVRQAVEPIMGRLGGSFDGVCDPDRGSAFECRIPLAQK